MPEDAPNPQPKELAEDQVRPVDSPAQATTVDGFPMAANVKVAEVIPHIPRLNSSMYDTPYVDEASPTTEHNISDAHTAAVAEDEIRTSAADTRQLALAAESFTFQPGDRDDTYPATFSTDKYYPGANRLKEEVASNRAFQKIGNLPDGERKQEHFLKAVVSGSDPQYEFTRGKREDMVEDMRTDAAFEEDEAVRLGSWAVILEKNPPTRAFLKDRTPDWEDINPVDLIVAEDSVAKNLAKAKAWEDKLAKHERIHTAAEAVYQQDLADLEEDISPDDDERFAIVSVLTRELYDLTSPNSPDREAFVKLGSDDNTTVKDIKDYYKKICDQKAAKIRRSAGLTSKFIEDVRSGYAAKYQSSSTETQKEPGTA